MRIDIKKYFCKTIEWINVKRKMLIFFVIFAWAYIFFHEYVHYFTMGLLGHSGYLSWNLISPYLHINDIYTVPSAHIFLITIMPHLVGLLLLVILFILNSFNTKNNRIFSIIAFFPFLDILWNILVSIPIYFIGGSADYANIVKLGGILDKIALVYTLFFTLIILIFSLYLFKPFKKTVLDMLKIRRNNLTLLF